MMVRHDLDEVSRVLEMLASRHRMTQTGASNQEDSMKIVECVPNISEGRNPEIYNAVAEAAAAVSPASSCWMSIPGKKPTAP